MNGFDKRSISSSKTLGDRLRDVRTQAGISLERAATDLRIKQAYLEAIEDSNYTALPSRVFVTNYVRNYASYLKVSRSTADELLQAEFAVYENDPNIPTLQKEHNKRPLRVVHFVFASVIALVVLLVATYFITEIANIDQPPQLTISEVPVQVPFTQRFITISGNTDTEATITINDQPIDVELDGSFSQVMGLQEGINLFKIVAKTKRSKENITYKQIVVDSQEDN